MKSKIFNIERPLKESDDKSAYGFLSRLDKEVIKEAIEKSYPNMPNFCLSKVEIHPSGFCNLKCKFCYGKKLAPQKRINLSTKKIKEVLENIRKNFPNKDILIILSGLYSDPLTHQDIKKIIKLLGDYKFRFGIYTNGLLIDNSLMKVIIDSAYKSNSPKPSYISFNIAASLISYQFKRILPLIKKLFKKNKQIGNRLEINTPIVVPKKAFNYDLLFNIIKELDLAGVDNIRLSLPWIQHDRNKIEKYVSLSKEDYEKSINFFYEMQRHFKKVRVREPQNLGKFPKCFAMSMSLSISPEGNVYPCPETSSPIFKKEFSFGNIHKNKISEIWKSKKHLNVFSKLNPNKSRCLCCPVNGEFNSLCKQFLRK
ncbi:radical SAM protein [Candidatus Pacearchaeota archaeon]|nr:radical SAM protein [Candidatus Pacearchaeota archaeon]